MDFSILFSKYWCTNNIFLSYFQVSLPVDLSFRAAVNKMEIRKFEKNDSVGINTTSKLHKKRSILCLPSKRRYLPVFGSLTSVARSYNGQVYIIIY